MRMLIALLIVATSTTAFAQFRPPEGSPPRTFEIPLSPPPPNAPLPLPMIRIPQSCTQECRPPAFCPGGQICAQECRQVCR